MRGGEGGRGRGEGREEGRGKERREGEGGEGRGEPEGKNEEKVVSINLIKELSKLCNSPIILARVLAGHSHVFDGVLEKLCHLYLQLQLLLLLHFLPNER